MKSLYTVQVSERHETALASALIAAQFTFSYSHAAGFKVAVDKADSVAVHELSGILHKLHASATDGNIPDMLPTDAYKEFAATKAKG